VVALSLGLLRVLAQPFAGSIRWLFIPLVLVTAAFFPPLLRKRSIKTLGIHGQAIPRSIYLCILASLVVFPAVLGAMVLAKRYAWSIPLVPAVPGGDWGEWILYQFFYVAVAEELFFRGYLQGSLLRMVEKSELTRRSFWNGMTVAVSALVFALAHWYILGTAIAAATFFPGLIFGWLFLRTRTLTAPILFHGMANTFYAVGVSFLG